MVTRVHIIMITITVIDYALSKLMNCVLEIAMRKFMNECSVSVNKI